MLSLTSVFNFVVTWTLGPRVIMVLLIVAMGATTFFLCGFQLLSKVSMVTFLDCGALTCAFIDYTKLFAVDFCFIEI